MRRVVSLIRAPGDAGDPSPTLRYLDDLVDNVRAAGLLVDLQVRGDLTGVPSGVDAAAFRFVQEALTNVIKHAGAAPTKVIVNVTTTALELEVEDNGPGPVEPMAAPGHGLVGMAERVSVYGGQFASGARPGRGFRVWASIPLGSS
jgi:signal transduction histidine kinase